MSLNILDFIYCLCKLHPQQNKGGEGWCRWRYNMLGALKLPTDRPGKKIIKRFLFFIYCFSYFSYGEISTVRFKVFWFELNRWARLSRAVEAPGL